MLGKVLQYKYINRMIDTLIFKRIGVNVSRETFLTLDRYVELLKKWQKAINLISNSTLSDIYNRHILDSAQLYPYIVSKNNIGDLGSGAGFPGMILAILNKKCFISLIESDNRKCEFLSEIKRQCKVDNVEIINNRIEKLTDKNFDCLVSRALTSITNILTLSANIRGKNCEIVLLKGEKYKQELAIAKEKYILNTNIYDSITDNAGKIIVIQEVK